MILFSWSPTGTQGNLQAQACGDFRLPSVCPQRHTVPGRLLHRLQYRLIHRPVNFGHPVPRPVSRPSPEPPAQLTLARPSGPQTAPTAFLLENRQPHHPTIQQVIHHPRLRNTRRPSHHPRLAQSPPRVSDSHLFVAPDTFCGPFGCVDCSCRAWRNSRYSLANCSGLRCVTSPDRCRTLRNPSGWLSGGS
jgi:hypothetical protein